MVISKIVKTKTSSEYFIGYLDKAIRPVVLIMPKLSGYFKTFKVEGSFCIDHGKLLEKY